MHAFSVLLCVAAVSTATAFSHGFANIKSKSGLKMVGTEQNVISSVEAPDFYWKFRLDRLVSKKGGDLEFVEGNYPDVSGFKDLYDAYYLDLTLQGKLEGFDWDAEKKINDFEWQKIYKSIAAWSQKAAGKSKPDTTTLPENDFDLLKQFYPTLNFRDLETPFSAEEVGSNFPYKSMKEMLGDAVAGKFNVPGYSGSTGNLEATEAKTDLAKLKESTMQKLDSILADTTSYASNPFPDATAKSHYKALKEKLAGFPQGKAEWDKFRANMEKEVDEMARLASKKYDPHHDAGMSPAEEFKQKYGKDLDEMQELMNKYKSDPTGFLENSIVEKYGKNGLDVWKKSQEFSEKLSVMSESDKAATEKAFSDFLDKA